MDTAVDVRCTRGSGGGGGANGVVYNTMTVEKRKKERLKKLVDDICELGRRRYSCSSWAAGRAPCSGLYTKPDPLNDVGGSWSTGLVLVWCKSGAILPPTVRGAPSSFPRPKCVSANSHSVSVELMSAQEHACIRTHGTQQ